jgi:probable HAF family extracellular repeat protein
VNRQGCRPRLEALEDRCLLSYSITDLGTLGGTPSVAYGINASGQVAGLSYTAGGVRHAFLWQNGAMQDLGTFGGGTESQGLAINNSGQVVGWSDSNGATLWQNGSIIDLNSLIPPTSGLQLGVAQGINSAGSIVGQDYHRTDGLHSAFLLGSGGVIDLGTLGGRESNALGINTLGQVVGQADTGAAGAVPHAFLWQNGVMADLGTLLGGTALGSSLAYGINDSGHVVGWSDTTGGGTSHPQHAFLWQNGTMTDLGTLGGSGSVAQSINNLDQVVGSSSLTGDTGSRHAFLWQNSTMTDLNSLIPANSGWILVEPLAINDRGQIVGSGTINGQTHAFLVTPPASTGVQDGQTEEIGFWHGEGGQALIRGFNGGPNATALANWLATNFANVYGANAGSHNLTGQTNGQVAAFFQGLFAEHHDDPDVQVLATALNVYATTASLGGTAAQAYGFRVTAEGLGANSFNVGRDGAAFGVADGTTLNVFQLLRAVDRRAVRGVLYNGDRHLGDLAEDLFERLNRAGD